MSFKLICPLATSDGCIRILDRSLSISNSPVNAKMLSKPISTPYVLPTQQSLQLKVLLQHYIGSSGGSPLFLFEEKASDNPVK